MPRFLLEALDTRDVPAVVNFSLVTANSTLALSGTYAGATMSPQGSGALSTTYTGSLRLDLATDGSTLQFLSDGTSMVANNSGTWQPRAGGGSFLNPGNAPANYGGNVTVSGLASKVAARGIIGSFSSSPIGLNGTDFTSSQSMSLTAGTFDYYNIALQGTAPISSIPNANSASDGSLLDSGDGNYTLTAPVNTTVVDNGSGQPLVMNIVGSIRAVATLPVVDLNGPGSGSGSAFTFTGAATLIAPQATVTRNPGTNLSSMTLRLPSTPDGTAESLAANLAGSGLSTTGYDSSTGTLTITGNGSLATYQSVLRSVTYANTLATPGPRAVEVSVSDTVNASFTRVASGTIPTPPAKVASVLVNPNDASGQRSRVEAVKITFNRTVAFTPAAASAFTLERTDGATVTLDATVDNTGPATVVTLAFSGPATENGSLADGRYTLTVRALGIENGNFDGNGNGTPGDDHTITSIFRLFGDTNGDATVDGGSDFTLFAIGNVSPTTTAFDFNADGTIDGGTDFSEFGTRFGRTI